MNRPPPPRTENVAAGLLGDTAQRDYSAKLRLFNAFAKPELCAAIDELVPRSGCDVLDVGCGTGEALDWLHRAMGGRGRVVGLDLSGSHLRAARETAPVDAWVLQGDMLRPPFASSSFDLAWAVNALNHLHDPVAGLRALATLLRPGGRMVIGQSSFVPDMYFAWDARLERIVNDAVRRYYRERYGRSEREFSAVRNVVGWLQQAGTREVRVRTRMIERAQPLSDADRDYLLDAIFRGTWGERLRGYMDAGDFAELMRLCDPEDAHFALRRRDFHFLQTLTIVVATR